MEPTRTHTRSVKSLNQKHAWPSELVKHVEHERSLHDLYTTAPNLLKNQYCLYIIYLVEIFYNRQFYSPLPKRFSFFVFSLIQIWWPNSSTANTREKERERKRKREKRNSKRSVQVQDRSQKAMSANVASMNATRVGMKANKVRRPGHAPLRHEREHL